MSTLLLSPTEAEVQARFADIVARSLRIDPDRVTPGASLDALGAESLDLVEITIDVENAFGILLPEQSILDSAREVLGEGVVEREGRLTEVGRRMVAHRMPELAPEELAALGTVADLRPVFLRVDTWLRVIRFVLDHSPRRCAACDVPLVTGAPERLRCPACRAEVDLPRGDDLNRAWVRNFAREHAQPPA